MSSTQNESTETPTPWQGKAWTQLLAVVLGVLALYSSLITLELRSESTISIQGFILYLAVISPLGIVIALLLLRFLCGVSPRDLNLRPGKLSSDLLAVLVLSLVVIVASVISTQFLSELLPESPSSRSVADLFAELAGNPGLLVLFAGPLFLVGAASEEVVRVFMLSRLWKVWPSIPAKVVSIMISAGFGHILANPLIPIASVRLSHMIETATSTFVFGLAKVWLLHREHHSLADLIGIFGERERSTST